MKSEEDIKKVFYDCVKAIPEYELSEEGGDLINQGWIEALQFVLDIPNCHICGQHPIWTKDYRFIESCGLQGKVMVCRYCMGLNDVAIADIIRNKLDPKQLLKEK
jgi:hypothetical protein